MNNQYMNYNVRGNDSEAYVKRGLPKGTYYLRVKCYHNYYDYQNDMDYSTSVTFTSSNYYEKEVNSSMTSANLINLNTKYTGNIDNAYDYDYYKIIVPSDGAVGVNFEHEQIPGDSQKYWTVKLLDSNNNVYINYDVAGNNSESYVKRGLPKGTYYLSVITIITIIRMTWITVHQLHLQVVITMKKKLMIRCLLQI